MRAAPGQRAGPGFQMRGWLRPIVPWLGLLLGLLGGLPRAAAEGADSTAHFRSVPGTHRLSHLSLTPTEPRYRWLVGLLYNYNRAPLTGDDAGLIGTRNLISDQHLAELQIMVGLPWVDVGLAFPFIVSQRGEPWTAPDGTARAPVATYAAGDLRLHGKVNLINPRRYDVGLAAAVSLTTPTGQVDRWAGNPGVVLDGRLVLDYWVGRTAVFVLNVGYVFRSHTEQIADLRIDDALEIGVGVRISFADFGLPFSLWGEIVTATQIDDPFGAKASTPVEGRFGLRIWNTQSFFIQIGWGVAISHGAGLPAYRALVDIGLTFDTPWRRPPRKHAADRDADGIPDAQDRCPGRAEDYDRFEDADGCPEDAAPSLQGTDRQKYRRKRATPWWRRWRWKRDARRRRRSRARARPRTRPRTPPRPRTRPRPDAPAREGTGGPAERRRVPRRPASRVPDLSSEGRSIKQRAKRLGAAESSSRRRVPRVYQVPGRPPVP